MKPHRPSITYAAPLVIFACALSLAPLACDSQPEPTPEPRPVGTPKPAATAATKTPQQIADERRKAMMPGKPTKKKVSAKPTAEVKASEDDPVKGKWSLDDATKGLPKGDELVATIETDQGSLECTLFADKAPITVANFVGLARGIRPWKNGEGKWVKEPAYDTTPFHRIIKGFMIQGGDTLCKNFKKPEIGVSKCGAGEAGYVIPDEVWEDMNHDRPGLLCMANRGPNTNSAQFFITDEAAFHLDYDSSNPRSSGYTIFGECSPVDLVHKLASTEMDRGDKPKEAPEIKKVTVTRRKAEKKAETDKDKAKDGDKAATDKAAPSGSAKAGEAPKTSTSATPKTGDKTGSSGVRADPPGPMAPRPTM